MLCSKRFRRPPLALALMLLSVSFAATAKKPVEITVGLGTSLPQGISAPMLVKLLAPGQKPTFATLVGMKSWRFRPNSYVALVCLASTQSEAGLKPQQPSCAPTYNRATNTYTPIKAYIGLVEYGANLPLKLIAGNNETIGEMLGWRDVDIARATESNNIKALHPSEFTHFDLAPYKINDQETAFGLRVDWFTGYAGGGAEVEALILFKIDNNQLINIFYEPVYFSEMLAGEWNQDGTRSHGFSETKRFVSLLSRQSHGYFDLWVSTPGDKLTQTFQWDPALKRYVSRSSKH